MKYTDKRLLWITKLFWGFLIFTVFALGLIFFLVWFSGGLKVSFHTFQMKQTIRDTKKCLFIVWNEANMAGWTCGHSQSSHPSKLWYKGWSHSSALHRWRRGSAVLSCGCFWRCGQPRPQSGGSGRWGSVGPGCSGGGGNPAGPRLRAHHWHLRRKTGKKKKKEKKESFYMEEKTMEQPGMSVHTNLDLLYFLWQTGWTTSLESPCPRSSSSPVVAITNNNQPSENGCSLKNKIWFGFTYIFVSVLG